MILRSGPHVAFEIKLFFISALLLISAFVYIVRENLGDSNSQGVQSTSTFEI